MGSKKINLYQMTWDAGKTTTQGVMTGTSTITTNPQDISNFDNVGLEVTWTGTPTGTISVLASNGGTNYYALTFNPILAQPAGSAGGYLIDLNQVPFTKVEVQYVNASGSGLLSVYLNSKDVN